MSERTKLIFDFNWKLTLCVVFVFAALVKLSVLQIDHAREKTKLQNQWREQQAAVALEFSTGKKYANYQKVTLSGFFKAEKYWLVENQFHDNRLGYKVIMPFELDSGALIAVDRGWIEGSPLQQALPMVETLQTRQLISGVLALPSDLTTAKEAKTLVKFWPRKIPELDLSVMSEQSGISLYAKVLHLDAESPASLTVLWRPFEVSAAVHYGYAFRWALMAMAILLLYLCIAFNVTKLLVFKKPPVETKP